MSVDCRRLVELLHDFISGELPPEEFATLREHIEKCPPCEIFVMTYRQTITITRNLPARPIPDDVAERLRQALHRASGEP